jgi:hypothetical protein
MELLIAVPVACVPCVFLAIHISNGQDIGSLWAVAVTLAAFPAFVLLSPIVWPGVCPRPEAAQARAGFVCPGTFFEWIAVAVILHQRTQGAWSAVAAAVALNALLWLFDSGLIGTPLFHLRRHSRHFVEFKVTHYPVW